MTRITFDGSRYQVHDGETALDALLRGGANVTFSCRRGSCQVCLLRTNGELDADARRGLRESMRERGYFLPCVTRPKCDLDVEKPDLSELFVKAVVTEKRLLSDTVVALSIETETKLEWRAGQYVTVRRADGLARSYSIASIAEEDYYLELHVERVPGGAMSTWLCDQVEAGTELEVQGPIGAMLYEPELTDRPLLLVGTGTGLAPLIGIARDALRLGHRGEIFLYHGASQHLGLYLRPLLTELVRERANFHYIPCVSRGRPELGVTAGRANDVAFAAHPDLSNFVVYLAGSPEVVHDARTRAVGAGADRKHIHADPFEPTTPFMPNDNEKLDALPGDPELWLALKGGAGLTEILEDFYGRVFEDARLAPFFHNITKKRAIEKQYEFLASIFTGDGKYFGFNPFNAHHWMVISDELFDYREALFDECLRRYGLSDELRRRWAQMHETWRREIVKSSPRGLIRDGVEQQVEGYSDEVIDFATVCDGCTSEMNPGARGRMHIRTGKLFCTVCSARKVGSTIAPPAA